MRTRYLTVIAVAVLVAAGTDGGVTAEPARANETVWSCGLTNAGGVNRIFTPSTAPGTRVYDHCSSGHGLDLNAPGTVSAGQGVRWQANAPAGLRIVVAYVPPGEMATSTVANGTGYGGGFYWSGGRQDFTDNQSRFGALGFSSNYFGFDLLCGFRVCRGGQAGPDVQVHDIGLQVQEIQGPALSAGAGLWQSSGWVRSDWPLSFTGDSPSGVCALSASLDGQPVGGAQFPLNDTVWHQCAATGLATTVHTSQFPNGAASLTLHGSDAAQVSTPDSFTTRTIYTDNQLPSVSFAGPSDASAAAGTQFVTVNGAAGPSGVSAVGCSLDGAPYQSYAQASVQVPVSGVGIHHLTCSAANSARDAAGQVATSAPQTWTLSIREPTVGVLSFSRLVNALRCHRVTARVSRPGRVVLVHRGHKVVAVHRRRHSRLERVERCRPRVVLRRVTSVVTVRRHHKLVKVKRTRTVRVVLVPHVVGERVKRVPYGHATTVGGWLGTTAGTGLGGQPVQLLTAPDNGQHAFTALSTVTTAPNGFWSVHLPAGPSRLVIAVYHGGLLTEPDFSGLVRVVVPARVRLISVTRRVAWGQTVRIVGQLDGGYLPPGGALVRLRIGQGSAVLTYGVKTHVTGSGRFTTAYTFGAGDPAAHRSFFFQLASLPTGDYPYAPAASRRLSVIVGGHPATKRSGGHARHRRHHHRAHRRRHRRR